MSFRVKHVINPKTIKVKRFLLLFALLLLAALVTTSCSKPIITINIVIPKKWVPYYDWLMIFPGWQAHQQINPSYPYLLQLRGLSSY